MGLPRADVSFWSSCLLHILNLRYVVVSVIGPVAASFSKNINEVGYVTCFSLIPSLLIVNVALAWGSLHSCRVLRCLLVARSLVHYCTRRSIFGCAQWCLVRWLFCLDVHWSQFRDQCKRRRRERGSCNIPWTHDVLNPALNWMVRVVRLRPPKWLLYF